jgi:cobalt-zinc-cadmium efflux system protein
MRRHHDHDHPHGHEHQLPSPDPTSSCPAGFGDLPAGAFRNAFSDRIFEYRPIEGRRLGLALTITFLTMLVEIAGGIVTGSISLISDAGHMFTHAFAIVIALASLWIARNPPCHHRTFGLFRAEILAAFTNSLFLFAVTLWIVWESLSRLFRPVPVATGEMLIVALVGLAVNLLTMLILRHHHEHDLNVRGVFLHLAADTLSSVAIVAGALLIRATGWDVLDPLIGLGISSAIGVWAVGLFRDSSRILLEMAPPGTDVDSLAAELAAAFPDIGALENVHFWAITGSMYVFTAHLRPRAGSGPPGELVERVTAYLKERHPIVQATIQTIPAREE